MALLHIKLKCRTCLYIPLTTVLFYLGQTRLPSMFSYALSTTQRGSQHRTHSLLTDRHTHKHVRGRGFPGRRLIVGVCRLGRGTEQTSALCDSWRTTEEQLLKAAHSFLPANGEAGVLFWTDCSVSFSPPKLCIQDISVLLFL